MFLHYQQPNNEFVPNNCNNYKIYNECEETATPEVNFKIMFVIHFKYFIIYFI